MKKIVLFVSTVLAAFVLVACGGKTLESVEIEIGFANTGDKLSGVTGDLVLPTTLKGGFTVTWESKNIDIIEVTGKVNHNKVDKGKTIVVVLIPTVTKGGKNSVRSAINVTVNGSKEVQQGILTLLNDFDISKAAFGTGYGGNTRTAVNLFDKITSQNISIWKVQAQTTAEVSTGTPIDQKVIVLRGFEKGVKVSASYLEFNVTKKVSKITLDVAHWNTYVGDLADAMIETEVGGVWTTYKSFKSLITSTTPLTRTTIELKDLDISGSFRISVSGGTTATAGSAARVVISGIKFFTNAI